MNKLICMTRIVLIVAVVFCFTGVATAQRVQKEVPAVDALAVDKSVKNKVKQKADDKPGDEKNLLMQQKASGDPHVDQKVNR